MAVSGNRIIRVTADDDLYDSGQKRLLVAGVRLVAGSGAAATALIREGGSNGQILCSLAAVTSTADESCLSFPVDSGKLWIDLTGAGAEVYIYLA